MKVYAEVDDTTRARVEEAFTPQGTHHLVVGEVEFSGTLRDIESVMDQLQHDLMVLRSPALDRLALEDATHETRVA